jgi:hypothetical protein
MGSGRVFRLAQSATKETLLSPPFFRQTASGTSHKFYCLDFELSDELIANTHRRMVRVETEISPVNDRLHLRSGKCVYGTPNAVF